MFFSHGPSGHMSTRVGVVMSVEHKIDAIFVEQRLPIVTGKLEVPAFGRGEYGVVTDDDLPFGGAVLELLFNICGLLSQPIIGVENNDSYVLIIYRINGFVQC